jgi:hypothetical protein
VIIENQKYNKLLFVHIPKTAGTSILNTLKEKQLDPWNRNSVDYPRGHLPIFMLKQQNNVEKNVFTFAVVRNPYTRTYSCFHQYNKTNKTSISFLEYLKNIQKNNISRVTPLLHLPQYLYVVDEFGSIATDKIYKFENLSELENDLELNIGFDNMGNYMVELYNKDYTKEAIDLVKKIYSSDFERFGYSKNFERAVLNNE